MRAAVIACVVAEVNRDPKRNGRRFELWDFMPFVERPAADPDVMLAYAESINTALGGLDLRGSPAPGASSLAEATAAIAEATASKGPRTAVEAEEA